MPRTSVEAVIANPAEEIIVAPITEQLVVAVPAVDEVVALVGSMENVIPRRAPDLLGKNDDLAPLPCVAVPGRCDIKGNATLRSG